MKNKVGERLSELRKENNLSQKEINEYLNLDKSDYSKIENGERKLNVSTLNKLCLLYNCSPQYILGESDEYSPSKIVFNINKKDVDLNIIAKVNETMNYLKILRELNEEDREDYLCFVQNIEQH